MRAGAEAMQGPLATGGVGSLFWDGGAGLREGRAGYYVKKEALCVQMWWPESHCHPGASAQSGDLKPPLPEEMTSEAGLERGCDERD